MNKIYEVFPEGKYKVLTFSYDDGKVQDRRLVALFNEYGMKATFNLNSGLTEMPNRIPKSEWNELYKGHEIAVHTCTHPTIARCPSAEIMHEILDDRIELERVMGYPVRGIAFPNGSSDERCIEIARSMGMQYARPATDQFAGVYTAAQYGKEVAHPVLIGDATGFDIPEDYMHWVPTCHHNHDLLGFGKAFLALNKKQYLKMMYVWGHSFEFDMNDNWEDMEDFCKLVSHKEDIWYATNIEIVAYHNRFLQLQFAADNSFVYNPCAASVWLCVNDDRIVEVHGGETVIF